MEATARSGVGIASLHGAAAARGALLALGGVGAVGGGVGAAAHVDGALVEAIVSALDGEGGDVGTDRGGAVCAGGADGAADSVHGDVKIDTDSFVAIYLRWSNALDQTSS